MTEVTKDMLIGDILDADSGTAESAPRQEERALRWRAPFTVLTLSRWLQTSTLILQANDST